MRMSINTPILMITISDIFSLISRFSLSGVVIVMNNFTTPTRKAANPTAIQISVEAKDCPNRVNNSKRTGKPAKSGNPVIENNATSTPIVAKGSFFPIPLTPIVVKENPWLEQTEIEKLSKPREKMRGIKD